MLGCCFITSELPFPLALPLIHKDHADREVTASFPNIDLERLDRLEQNFTTFAANLKDLESARLPGRLALLEGACLEERLALLEFMNTAGVARIFAESILDILVELNQWFFHWFSSNRNGA